MRLLLSLAVSLSLVPAAGCVRRMPGSADVPAAEKYASAGSGRGTRNELAGRVMATYPNMLYDPGLDAVAKILAEDFGHSQELPGPLYIQELCWRLGVTSRYRYSHAGWTSGAGGVAHIDSLLAAVLATDKDLDGKAFGVHRTRIAYVMIVADTPVSIDPLPRAIAPGEAFTLAGKLRVAGQASLLLWGPGELSPRMLMLKEDGAWEPQQLTAPEVPGRYLVELATNGSDTVPLLLVPITVGAAPTAELDRPPPDGPDAVEAEARRIVTSWRVVGKKAPLVADPAADERARRETQKTDDGFLRDRWWWKAGTSRHAWEYQLLELQAPDVGSTFATADGEVLAVGAARASDNRRLRVEVLKRKP